MATRFQHIKKVNKNRAKASRDKIENFTLGMFSFEYKLKNGEWNISKLARDTGLTRKTIYRYIK